MIPTNELIQQQRSLKSSRCNLSPGFSINRINVGVSLKAVSCHRTLLGKWDVDNIFFSTKSFVPNLSLPINTASVTPDECIKQTSSPWGCWCPHKPETPGALLSCRKRRESQTFKCAGQRVCVEVRKSWRGLITEASAVFL